MRFRYLAVSVGLAACGGSAPPPAAPPPVRPAPAPAPAAPAPVATDPEAIAREVVAKLEAGDYKAVAARFDEKMAAGLPVDKLEATWKQLATAVGAFDKIESASTRDEPGYHVVSLTAHFARARLIMLISIDDHGKIGGFFIRPSEASTVEWKPPAYAKLDAFDDNPVTVGSDPALPGTLSLPRGTGPFAAVVLVHGSGPNDADETVGGVKVFKDLAVGLASRGIAVLRYDKRTHVSPTGVRTQKEEVDDAAHAAVAFLKTTSSIDRKRIILLGHSQGGYLAPRIAKADPGIRALIIFAGATRPLEESIVAQLKYISTLAPGDEQVRTLLGQAEKFKQVVQSPTLKPDDSVELPTGGTITGAYFLEVRNYHPEKVAAQLSIPIAILQGERDYQVTVAGDLAAWKAALGKRKSVTFFTYPDANHAFVAGTGQATPAEYSKPGHVEDKVIDDLAGWIAKLPK
jgi:dienelactone hydrolase